MIRIGSKLIALTLFLSSVTFANPHKIVTHYSDLTNALAQGHSVRAIMDFSKCTPSIDNMAGMNFTVFNIYKTAVDGQLKSTIATSSTILTHHTKLGLIYNFVRLRIFEDSSVEVFSEYVNPTSYTSLGNSRFTCHLTDGKEQKAITLYLED